MIHAHVKTDVQQQIKELVAVSSYVLLEVPSKLEIQCNKTGLCISFNFGKYLQNVKYNVKQVCVFHLILVGISSSLILPVKNVGNGGFSLKTKNLLSVTKIIC